MRHVMKHPNVIPSIENAQGRAKHPVPMFPFKMARRVCTLLVVEAEVERVVDGIISLFASVVAASLLEISEMLGKSPFMNSALYFFFLQCLM
jgi:hypothetical protein